MLSKKKKVFILVGMAALLVLTGYLNILLNNSAQAASGDATEAVGFFETCRADRIATRNQTMLYLESIINNEAASQASRDEAEEQWLAITAAMAEESALEALIKSLGFEDAFVSGANGTVNVIVKAEALTDDDATRILEAIETTTAYEATDVRLINV